MGHPRRRFWSLTASGIVSGSAGPWYETTLHGYVLTESGGVTNETLDFYTPVSPGGGQDTGAPTSGGTHEFQIVVPKGTTAVQWFGDDGIYFKDGLYVAISGGTFLGGLILS